MSGALLAELAQAACGFALLGLGAAMGWASGNAVKRVGGVVLGVLGALLTAAALGAPAPLLLAAVGVAFAHLIVGGAILVRLQEGYGGVEIRGFDEADEAAEPKEPIA